MVQDLHDCYKILTPRTTYFKNLPLIWNHSLKQRWISRYNGTKELDGFGLREAMNMVHSTHGLVGIKMLNIYRDGNEHHYREIVDKLFPGKGYGHDIDCWRALVHKGLIKLSSTRNHGSNYYKITPLGLEILDVADANNVYFRIARWFKVKGENFFSAMMKADLNGEETWKDLLPEAMIALFEQLFNPESRLREIGSAYRWMNNFMFLIKTNNEFYEKATAPEVMAWLESNKSKYHEIENYLKKLSRIQKKRMKNAA